MKSPYNNGEWTQSRFESFIKGILRTGSLKWPPRFQILNAAKKGKQVNQSSGRMAEHYECNECHSMFPSKEVRVDHIDSVVPLSGFVSWDNVIQRLFCESEGLQVLCVGCHKVKTKEENETRKTYKNNNKEDDEQV